MVSDASAVKHCRMVKLHHVIIVDLRINQAELLLYFK